MPETEKHRLQRAREFILRCETNRELQINISYTSYKKLRKEFIEILFHYPCHLNYDYDNGILTIVNFRGRVCSFACDILTDLALNRAKTILASEGLPDEIVGSLQSLGNPTIHSLEPNIDLRPDRSIFSSTDPLVPRIVFIGGVSLEYPYLWEKARKWLTGIRCKTVLLVSFKEKNEFSTLSPPLHLTVAEREDLYDKMNNAFVSTSKDRFEALAFGGNIWYDQLQEVFVELVRRNSSEPDGLESSREYLVRDGVDVSESVPRVIGGLRIGDFVPKISVRSLAIRVIPVDFFDRELVMDTIWGARIGEALDRFLASVVTV
ncbi:hypothetical protein V1525DRAFT_406738 [Lipomyces kononenkoae]|uniref:Uncharacterized protein n=1 Tax=Lipomyces kononenkoae TaxID=34357 RepID=A0ACC3SXY2_LIPKO